MLIIEKKKTFMMILSLNWWIFCRYVKTKKEFESIDPASTDYVLGLFSDYDLNFSYDLSSGSQPRLFEMVSKVSVSPSIYFYQLEFNFFN